MLDTHGNKMHTRELDASAHVALLYHRPTRSTLQFHQIFCGNTSRASAHPLELPNILGSSPPKTKDNCAEIAHILPRCEFWHWWRPLLFMLFSLCRPSSLWPVVCIGGDVAVLLPVDASLSIIFYFCCNGSFDAFVLWRDWFWCWCQQTNTY